MKQPLVQILVLVANIHMRTMKTEVEKGSMSTAVGHGLAGPKTNCNYFQGQFSCLYQKGVRLIFLNYLLWC